MGCRKRREKKELIRLMKHAEGTFVRCEKKNPSGRGFYVCPDMKCLKGVRKKQGRGTSRTGPTIIQD
jgi:hypothetical protein